TAVTYSAAWSSCPCARSGYGFSSGKSRWQSPTCSRHRSPPPAAEISRDARSSISAVYFSRLLQRGQDALADEAQCLPCELGWSATAERVQQERYTGLDLCDRLVG